MTGILNAGVKFNTQGWEVGFRTKRRLLHRAGFHGLSVRQEKSTQLPSGICSGSLYTHTQARTRTHTLMLLHAHTYLFMQRFMISQVHYCSSGGGAKEMVGTDFQ